MPLLAENKIVISSIPLALDTAIRAGQIKRGQHLLMEGVGGGFTWAAAVVKY